MNKKSNTTDGTFEQLTSDDANLTKIIIHYTSEPDNYIECHGCSRKGWIENSKGDIKKCPVCDGKGKLDKEKNSLPYYPRYPWYPWPSRTDVPYLSTDFIVTCYNTKTDNCTNCCNQK